MMCDELLVALALLLPGSPYLAPAPQVAPHPSVAPTAPPPAPAGAAPISLAAPSATDPSSTPGRLPVATPLRQAALSTNVSPAAAADRTPFDYRQVRLRQDHGNWKLAAGSFELADFGGDDRAARLGLSAVQYYRFTERRQVGAGPVQFSYLLANGQAPRGPMFGMDGQPFQPDRLEVHKVEGSWAVCAGDDPLVKTGEDREEAGLVLDVIRKLRCDRICRLGAADGKGLTVLIRTR